MGIAWTNAQRVRAYLRKHHAKCPGCAYDLHGLEATRCPECGRTLLIGELLPPHPFEKRWMCFRIGIFAIWLLSAAVAGWVVINDVREWSDVLFTVFPLFGFLFLSTLMMAAIRAARGAYLSDRWMEFERTTLRNVLIFGVLIGGFAVLNWVLLNLIWP